MLEKPSIRTVKNTGPVLDLAPRYGMGLLRAGWTDISEGLRLWRLVMRLGYLDVRLRYRGSILGPWWITLSRMVMIGAMWLVYGQFFGMTMQGYLPFLVLSVVLWGYLGALMSEAPMVFVDSRSVLHAARLPLTVPVLRMVMRNLLVVSHDGVVIIGLFAFMGIRPVFQPLWYGGAIFLWAANSICISFLLGLLGARFRDVGPVVASVLQGLFFLMPILWHPSQLPFSYQWLYLNPLYPFFELLRAPLLGHSFPDPAIWLVAFGQGAILWSVTLLVLCRFRARLTYWI